LNTRSVDAGYFVSATPTRLGRATSSPPQFGQRPFRTPLVPIVPILGAVMCMLLLMSIMSDVKTRYFFAWYLGIGVVVYFLYSMRNSALERRPRGSA
jgi:amino acid permease